MLEVERGEPETDMELTAADVREMMDAFNAIRARAVEIHPDADAEQIYKITSAAFDRSLGIE